MKQKLQNLIRPPRIVGEICNGRVMLPGGVGKVGGSRNPPARWEVGWVSAPAGAPEMVAVGGDSSGGWSAAEARLRSEAEEEDVRRELQAASLQHESQVKAMEAQAEKEHSEASAEEASVPEIVKEEQGEEKFEQERERAQNQDTLREQGLYDAASDWGKQNFRERACVNVLAVVEGVVAEITGSAAAQESEREKETGRRWIR